jgi:hypothetical protein
MEFFTQSGRCFSRFEMAAEFAAERETFGANTHISCNWQVPLRRTHHEPQTIDHSPDGDSCHALARRNPGADNLTLYISFNSFDTVAGN